MSDPHAAKAAVLDDEPKTPLWLPALGAALFVSVGLWWAVSAPPAPAVDADQAAASAPSTPPPSPPPPQTAPPQRPMPQVPPPGSAPSMPSNLPKGMQDRIQRMRNGGAH